MELSDFTHLPIFTLIKVVFYSHLFLIIVRYYLNKLHPQLYETCERTEYVIFIGRIYTIFFPVLFQVMFKKYRKF